MNEEIVIPTEEAAPLFTMDIIGNPEKRIPTTLSGNFVHTSKGILFRTQLVGDNEGTNFLVNVSPAASSVFEYMIANSCKLTLKTHQYKSHIAVCSLESRLVPTKFPTDFLEILLRRCNRASTQGPDSTTPSLDSIPREMKRMNTMSQFESYIEIAKSSLPKWVIEAYEKNREQFSLRGIGVSDETKHAQKAIELLLNIDWTAYVPHVPSEADALAYLNKAFYGLDVVKNQILDVLAKIRRTGKLPKWGILLAGPAGVGKTSIVKVIASLLSMNIIQMDMTTIGDDPEYVSGSPRIYGNASPGKVIKEMSRNGSSTFLLLLNEIDKAVKGSARDATDTMLTILDKTGYYDNFVEEVIPTDNMFCIATCNDLTAVSRPLRDRFTVIELPAYSVQEKITIFEDYILPRFQKDACISNQMMQVSHEASVLLATQYAVDPGVRDLETFAERLTNSYCRTVESSNRKKRLYTESDIRKLFGPSRVSVRNWRMRPGMVKGVCFHDGKAITYLIQAIAQEGTGKFDFIGPSSQTMQNYAKVAYLAVKSSAVVDLDKKDITVFVTQPIPELENNFLGMAVYIAICSSLAKVTIPTDRIFIGGMDLYASPYWDEATCNLAPLQEILCKEDINIAFAPSGIKSSYNTLPDGNESITKIVEVPDGRTLLSFVLSTEALAG